MRASKPFLLLLTLLAAMAFAAGCGSDDGNDNGGGSGSKSGAKTPAPLKSGGEFVVCTDVPYPPAEYLEGDKFVGYEIDVMNEVAKRLGTDAEYEKTLFDSIIPSLNAKKCDAIISSMNVNPEREKQVNFVTYMEIGQSIMVQTGDAEGISSLDDLAGKSVAVQVGTTLKDAVDAKSKELKAAGKDPIDVQTFPDGGAAAAALKGDKVDAFFADSPVVAEYVNKDKDAFEFAGEPIDPIAVGIATRKADTELNDAIQDAMDEMYSDGEMEKILSKWKVEDFALKGN
ncbi:MAG: binding-protein-dependent transport system, secreted component [Thermoleophilia bacterium]|nr:binding-protein-dependent transport system, secreted component [Thermoleophilia bacterium]